MLSKSQIIFAVGLLLIAATVLTLSLRSRYPGRVPLVPPQRFRAWWFIVIGLVFTHKVGTNPVLGHAPNILAFTLLSVLALRQFFSHMKTKLSNHTKLVCYLAAFLQYYWIHIEWYGFFVVFVPVFMFLYLPVSDMARDESSPMLQIGSVHWILMTAIFCLSHAAFLVVFPGGPGLLFYVILITEFSDAVKMLLSRTEAPSWVSPVLSVAVAMGTAWIVGPAFTPLRIEHILLSGFVLGVAGVLGHMNISSLREELGLQVGGPMERVESLAYTAPIFLHGYRYFDYPII
jgi:phosphatidate cytidylyltransferase